MVVCSLFFADFHQQILVCLQHFRHRFLFRNLSNVGVVNLFGKVIKVVPSLGLSCSGRACMRVLLQMNLGLLVIQRMQSRLSECCVALSLLRGPVACLSSSRCLALK